MKSNVYLICTADEYELALCCCETVKEVAELIGVKPLSVNMAFYRAGNNICRVGGYQIEKVWLSSND